MREKSIDLVRLAALSDGIFAVAMTLLAVGLPLPKDAAELGGRPLGEHLLTLFPQFRAVAISFVVAAAFWRLHHNFFRVLARGDGSLVWLNFLLLFGVVLTPLTTQLLGNLRATTATVDLYAGNLVLIGAALFLMWWRAERHRLLHDDVGPASVRRALFGSGTLVLVFLASIPLSWARADLAEWFWLLLVPISFLEARRRA